MRNLKKFLALALAMVMAFSLMLTANAASPKSFADKDSITKSYAEAVNVLSALKVVTGDEDGFRPGQPITRGEVAAMVYRAATGEATAPDLYKDYNWFGDVHESEWFAPYVNFCANAEWVKGDSGWFRPYDNITGYEVLAMILRAVGYDKNHEFEGSGWTIQTARIARSEGVTTHIAEGTLGSNATREMVAEMIFQALQIPTVTYNMLFNYQKDVLQPATTTADGKTIYPTDVYNTLMYQSFQIVGKSERIYRDGTYGRPEIHWVKDLAADTVQAGTKYVVNTNVGTWDADPDNDPSTDNGAVIVTGGIYTTNNTAETGGAVAITVPIVAQNILYKEISECELTKLINRDDSIAWAAIKEYVNGNKVASRDDGTNPVTDDERLDALHTTVKTVNEQGRTMEVYRHAADADGCTWTFVYFDTLLGVVKRVIPRTFDTAGHVNSSAELWIEVNDQTNGANVVKATQRGADYTDKVGDLVLLTTWGMNDDTQVGTVGANNNNAILAAVPTAADDFRNNTSGAWCVDRVGTPDSKVVTINFTLGTMNDKTGLIGADGVTYMGTWAYHNDGNSDMTDHHANHTAGALSTVPDGYDRLMKNEMVGSTYTLYLDKTPDHNVVGMAQGIETNVGVIMSMDPERIATGKWALNVDMFMADGTPKTVQMLKPSKALDGSETYSYFASQTDADDEFDTSGNYENLDTNALVAIESYTVDGRTFWKIIDFHTTMNVGTAVAGDRVDPGVHETLDNTRATNLGVDNDTVFIVAEYEYRYNQGNGTNVGGNVGIGYKVYKGFKNIPTVISGDDVMYQAVLSDTTNKLAKYVLVHAKDENDYAMGSKSTITVDDSYLLIKPIRTGADYSVYSALKDGQVVEIQVSNLNQTLNSKIEDAITGNNLIWITGRNSKGYVTDIETIDALSQGSAGDTVSQAVAAANTTTPGGENLQSATFNDGVALAYNDAGVIVTHNGAHYYTVADGCTVQIVNKDNGQVYPGTLASIGQYQATHFVVYELDANGYIAHLYIVD